MEHEMKFKDFIHYVSVIDRLSICNLETSCYQNYERKKDIPEGEYDDYYVYGVGMIDSEFRYEKDSIPAYLPKQNLMGVPIERGSFMILPCMEIMISKYPRQYHDEHPEELTDFYPIDGKREKDD